MHHNPPPLLIIMSVLIYLPQVRKHIDPESHLEQYYCPMKPFLHVPPPDPTDDWKNDFGCALRLALHLCSSVLQTARTFRK